MELLSKHGMMVIEHEDEISWRVIAEVDRAIQHYTNVQEDALSRAIKSYEKGQYKDTKQA